MNLKDIKPYLEVSFDILVIIDLILIIISLPIHGLHLVDYAGRIIKNEKSQKIFNFGKYKGQVVKEVFDKDPNYYIWIMQGDFTLNTKQEFKKIQLSK